MREKNKAKREADGGAGRAPTDFDYCACCWAHRFRVQVVWARLVAIGIDEFNLRGFPSGY